MKNIYKVAIAYLLLISCNNMSIENTPKNKDSAMVNTSKPAEASDLQLPFVGERQFETRPGISGTGTPHKYVEIMENGDVFFGYEQESQADGTISKERYNAGKFSKYLKCIFKERNETFYFEVTKDKIYEVDSNKARLTGEDCCNSDNIDMESKCPFEGEYF